MNKQIKQMANDLAKICPDLVESGCGQVNCVTHLTLSLCKEGYRKASDVAREIFEEIDALIANEIELSWQTRGATDATAAQRIIDALRELKKKYTESEGADK